MDVQHLVKMANNIADFFTAEGDKTKAANNIANHLKSFWEPRMRRARAIEQAPDNRKELILKWKIEAIRAGRYGVVQRAF